MASLALSYTIQKERLAVFDILSRPVTRRVTENFVSECGGLIVPKNREVFLARIARNCGNQMACVRDFPSAII
jgi:hypothetical protein